MPKVFLRELPNYTPDVLAVDLETTGLNPILDRPLSIALSDGDFVWIWLHTHFNGGFPDKLRTLLENPNVLKIYHNAVFDNQFEQFHYAIRTTNVWDTLVVEGNINNNQGIPNSLYDVTARRCGKMLNKDTRDEFIDHPGFDIRPVTSEQITYMAEDVLYLPNIKRQQMDDLSRDRLIPSTKIDLELLPITVDMRLQGMNLDVALWDSYIEEFDSVLESLELQTKGLLSEDFFWTIPRSRKKEIVDVDYYTDELNLRSYDHVREIINKLNPNGKPLKKTNVDTLVALLDTNLPLICRQFVENVLEHRSWTKAKGWNYPRFVNPVTSLVHPEWRINGAYTGRYSCADPNIQQTPKPEKGKPNLRRVWIPDNENYCLLAADYSQQEPRILGQLTQDKHLLEACNTEDVYIEFAKHLFGRIVEKDSEERQIAKQFVLAVGYGSMPDTLSIKSGLPIERCTEIRNMILSTFPGIQRWGKEQFTRMKHYGYVLTKLGRRMYFPQRFMQKYTNAVNNPVQGTAAEMFKLATIDVYNYLRDNQIDGRIWAGIHDELVLHVHRDIAVDLQPEIFRLMEEAGSRLCPDVRHLAEGKILDAWDK